MRKFIRKLFVGACTQEMKIQLFFWWWWGGVFVSDKKAWVIYGYDIDIVINDYVIHFSEIWLVW